MASGRKNNRTKAPKADEAKRATFLVDSQLHFGFKILSEKAERDMRRHFARDDGDYGKSEEDQCLPTAIRNLFRP